MKKFKVAFASNDGYAEHLAVAIHSLLKNLNEKFFAEIIILDGGISEEKKSLITNICQQSKKGNVEFILMDRKKFENLPTTRLSQEIYYRLDLPEILTKDSKIIYLDVDIIVNRNLGELFDIELNENTVGAVGEITTINYYKDDYNLSSRNKGLFFNSGILLMNLDKMRKINFKQKVYEGMNEYINKLTFHDQDILNIVCENNWLSLPPKYNALPFLRTTKSGKYLGYTKEEFQEAKSNPVIIHYASKKPRSNICYHPLGYLYNQYRQEIGLTSIKQNKPNIKQLVEKYYSRLGLTLLSNLPNGIVRYLIYKPSRKILKMRYK